MPDVELLTNVTFEISTRIAVVDEAAEPESWGLAALVHSDGADDGSPVLTVDGWTFDLVSNDLGLALDETNADTSVFGPLAGSDGLADDVPAGIGSRLVVLNHVWLDPEWRGLGGVGRYLTGLAIRQLDADAACVALEASPYELRAKHEDGNVPNDVWEAGARALHPVWESLGFIRYVDDVFALDPTLVTVDEAVQTFRTQIGF